MDNAAQNARLTEALNVLLAAREAVGEAMLEVLLPGMDIQFRKKKDKRVGTLLNFKAAANTMLIRDGRQIVEVAFSDFVEVLEPYGPGDAPEEPEDDGDEGEEAPFGHVSEFDTN